MLFVPTSSTSVHVVSFLQNHPETFVKTFGDLRTATLRAAAWDSGAHVIVFPPFTEYPDLHMISKVPPHINEYMHIHVHIYIHIYVYIHILVHIIHMCI